MFKFIFANLRWGKLSEEELQTLKTLPFKEVTKRPYLAPKLSKYYG